MAKVPATIYQQLKTIAKANPQHLRHYATDLTNHDRATLSRSLPGERFVWILRTCGTELFQVGVGRDPVLVTYWLTPGNSVAPPPPLAFLMTVAAARGKAGIVEAISHERARALAFEAPSISNVPPPQRNSIMKTPAMAAVLALILFCNAPARAQGMDQIIGTVIGGAGGGFLGSKIGTGSGQLAATAGGAVLGAWMGNTLGSSLDTASSTYSYQQRQVTYAPPPMLMTQPQAGSVYQQLQPTYAGPQYAYGAPATINNQQYCREVQTTIVVGGRPQPAYGTACQQPDGSWRLQ